MRKLLLLLFLFSCGRSDSKPDPWYLPTNKVRVLSTTSIVDDLVKCVGGEEIITTILIQGNLDPHTYQLVKGDDEKLLSADLIFYNGLGLEHGPSLKSSLEDNEKSLSLGRAVFENDPEAILHYGGVADPHIWMDISLYAKAIPAIAKRLAQERPEKKEYFFANAKKLQKSLAKTDAAVRRILQEVPARQRYLVTSHDAFNYFARAYLREPGEEKWQERFAAPEGLAPESQLSVSDIFDIITYMKKYRIKVLFPESNVSRDSIRKIVDAGNENGMELVIAPDHIYGDAMGPPGSEGDTYSKMMKHNAKVIAKHLKGGSL